MPSPTFYAYWEAKYGVRVAVKDVPGRTRVATWAVPQDVIDAAKPFAEAVASSDQDAIQATVGSYNAATADLKPPPTGATVIGWLVEEGDLWTVEGVPGPPSAIQDALELCVATAHPAE